MQLVLVMCTPKINLFKYNDKRKTKSLENFVSQHPLFVLQSNKVCVRERHEQTDTYIYIRLCIYIYKDRERKR